MTPPDLCVLTVHAHPDDEASKGAATIARYHAAGIRTVLVTCTGGEEGDILNPAMDRPEVRERIAEIRRDELAEAARIIGYDEVVMLGYRDSGMPDSPANADPRSFAQAPLDEAVGRLVEVIRRTRPQVVVTYPDDQSGYPHPDHLRVNEISEIAFEASGDPDRFPEAGPAWQPARLCYVRWSVKRMKAMHEKFLELGLESPFQDERLARILDAEAAEQAGTPPERPRVVLDVAGYTHVVREGLLAHATQVDPNSRHWFGLPPEVADTVYPYEEYEVARDLTGTGPSADDLFQGVRSV
ncbi:MAG TPA: mycothiol conjugate amidase Mca, partial [Acidimicrobiales bacterium]|nr:mycothiol conjugate amidase Mca [Acidimicrobiales bacterium]